MTMQAQQPDVTEPLKKKRGRKVGFKLHKKDKDEDKPSEIAKKIEVDKVFKFNPIFSLLGSEHKSKNLTQSNFYKKNYILKLSQTLGNDLIQEATRVVPLKESLTVHVVH